MHSRETVQLLALAEDLFDYRVEGLAGVALCVADQPLQPPEILRRVAQAVDVIEAQTLQPAAGDQTFDEAVNGLKVPASSTRNPASVLTSKKRR
jgi:hypothetical protein